MLSTCWSRDRHLTRFTVASVWQMLDSSTLYSLEFLRGLLGTGAMLEKSKCLPLSLSNSVPTEVSEWALFVLLFTHKTAELPAVVCDNLLTSNWVTFTLSLTHMELPMWPAHYQRQKGAKFSASHQALDSRDHIAPVHADRSPRSTMYLTLLSAGFFITRCL